MLRLHAAVAADVQVVALLGGDDAEVLALRLGAFARAAGDGALELVRAAQPLVAVLDAHGERRPSPARRSGTRCCRRRTSRCAAPCRRRDPTRSRPRRARARSAGSCSSARAEHVDALPAGDLGVEPVLLGDGAERDQLVGRHLAAGERAARPSRCRRAGCWRGSDRWCPAGRRASSSRTCSFQVEARIDATAGLQISQPSPRAVSLDQRRRTSRISCTRTRWNSSCRLYGKCSHRWLVTATPARFSSLLRRWSTQRHARAAAGAGLGARLDRAEPR